MKLSAMRATCLAIVGMTCAVRAGEAPPHEPFVLPGAHIEPVHSTNTGVDYDLYISLPRDYEDRHDRFPVIYLLDADYSFALSHQILRHFTDRGELQEAVLATTSGAWQLTTSPATMTWLHAPCSASASWRTIRHRVRRWSINCARLSQLSMHVTTPALNTRSTSSRARTTTAFSRPPLHVAYAPSSPEVPRQERRCALPLQQMSLAVQDVVVVRCSLQETVGVVHLCLHAIPVLRRNQRVALAGL